MFTLNVCVELDLDSQPHTHSNFPSSHHLTVIIQSQQRGIPWYVSEIAQTFALPSMCPLRLPSRSVKMKMVKQHPTRFLKSFSDVKRHAVLGFEIGGDLKTRIVPGMPLSSKTAKFLPPSPRCVEYMSAQGNFSLFVVTNHEI